MTTQSCTNQAESAKAKNSRAMNEAAFQQFDTLPDSAFVQIGTVVAVTSTSPATVYRMIKRGALPQSKKISGRGAARWNVGELRRALAAC